MATSADLIAAFADRVELPIPLNEVRDWLLGRRYQDKINFIPVDLDTGVIRGFLKRVRIGKGGWDSEPLDVSNIYYDRHQGAAWINLVCAKELLHILDAARCSTREQFDKLTASLALPHDLQHILQDPDFAVVDKLGDLPALALLLPAKAREILLPGYQQGIITDEAISEMAMIPPQHVRVVMSSNWPAVYDIIMSDLSKYAEDDDQMDLGLNGARAAAPQRPNEAQPTVPRS